MHSHEDGEADHDHDHDDPGGEYDPTESSLWAQDNITLLSVGIDIGSAGTQVIFSRVQLRRLSEDLTSRYFVVNRETVYQSPVALTPYVSEARIDDRAIGGIIDEAYESAGVHPDNIDTGAVILTGEALRRENAQAIAEVLAEVGGEFVCAAAGHHMESMLAAYGSGAAKASHDRGIPILNIDIGGGTTKLALLDDGKVVATGALAIGGRLLAMDADCRIVRIEDAVQPFAAELNWSIGDRIDPQALDVLAHRMAEALLETLVEAQHHARSARLYLTEPPLDLSDVDCIRFSGGMAEFIYQREERDFGDLGRPLGLALRAQIDAGRLPWRLLPPGECIRATALGASSYGMQVSGRTIYVSDPGVLLPRRNLRVLQPSYSLAGARIDPAGLSAAIRQHFTSFDVVEGEDHVALAFRWRGEPSYARIAAFAHGIVDALPETIALGRPLYIVLDGDIAQTLGALLKEEIGIASDVLVIDAVTLWDFDYVDLGRIRMPSYTVPVTIKSLVFKDDPRLPHAHAHPLFGARRHRP